MDKGQLSTHLAVDPFVLVGIRTIFQAGTRTGVYHPVPPRLVPLFPTFATALEMSALSITVENVVLQHSISYAVSLHSSCISLVAFNFEACSVFALHPQEREEAEDDDKRKQVRHT